MAPASRARKLRPNKKARGIGPSLNDLSEPQRLKPA